MVMANTGSVPKYSNLGEVITFLAKNWLRKHILGILLLLLSKYIQKYVQKSVQNLSKKYFKKICQKICHKNMSKKCDVQKTFKQICQKITLKKSFKKICQKIWVMDLSNLLDMLDPLTLSLSERIRNL